MIKKISILLAVTSLLFSCEKEEFNTPTPQVDSSNTCDAPEGLTVINVSNQFVNVSWISDQLADESQTWEIRYAKTFDTANTPIIDSDDIPTDIDMNINIITTQDNTITIDNLDPSETYEVQVRTVCGSGAYSKWSEAMEITTLK